MNKKYGKLYGRVTVAAVAAALTVSATAGVAGAEEILPTNEGQELETSPVVDIQATSEDTATVEVPSYTRDEAVENQDIDKVAGADKDDFLNHIVENTEAIHVSSKEELAQLLNDSIKSHTGAIVIEEEGDYSTLAGDKQLVTSKLVEEMEKLGLNGSALISGYSVDLVQAENGKLTWVLTPYFEETNALADAREQFINDVTSYVNANFTTDKEKLYALYSYLAQTTLYGTDTGIPSSSPSALILENQAVCEAFAYLYNEIGSKLGFNMKYVTGVATQNGEQIGHAWNLVELNGNWYNTDATWGNIDRNGKNSLEVNMSYFLFSDDIADESRVRDHDTLPQATDKTYDVLHNNNNTTFGGGVYGDLIVSPNNDNIVIFNDSTKTDGYSFPRATDDFEIFKTAVVDNLLYMAYFDKQDQTYKVGYMDLNERDSLAITAVANAIPANVQFDIDHITLGDGKTVSYEDLYIISKELNVTVDLNGDNDFPLQSQYDTYVADHDNAILVDFNTLLDSVNLDDLAQNGLDLELESAVTSLIANLKKTETAQAQQAILNDYISLQELYNQILTYTSSNDTEKENQILAAIEAVKTSTIQQKAIELFLAQKDTVLDGEAGNGDIPLTPIEPSKPIEPPTEGGGDGGDGDIPLTPIEPSKPIEPPTEGGGDGGNGDIPLTPIEPSKPIEPPTEGGGDSNGNGNGDGGTTNPPTDNGNGDGGTTNPPTDNGNGDGGTTNPPTSNDNVGGTVTTPPDNNNQDTNVTETPNVTDVSDIKIEGGTIAQYEDGTLVVTLNEESNFVATTVTIPVEKVKGVLRLKLADGTLKAVPYVIKDGKVIVTLHQSGTIVFIEPKVNFSDIENSQFKNQIELLAERGIFTGDEGKFNPGANITRAQFAGVLVRALGFNESSSVEFTDVNSNAWYAGSVAALKELDLMNGSNGNFNPSGEITRQQMFAIVGKLLEQNGVTANEDLTGNFKDANKVSAYAKDYVSVLVEIGAVNGDNGLLNPQGKITKGQMSKVLTKVLEHLEMI